MQTQGFVYLYHFAEPYKHSRHYIGWTIDVAARDKLHQAGKGARLLAVLHKAGIAYAIVRTWPGDKRLERAMKKRRCAPQYCPVCREAKRKAATP